MCKAKSQRERSTFSIIHILRTHSNLRQGTRSIRRCLTAVRVLIEPRFSHRTESVVCAEKEWTTFEPIDGVEFAARSCGRTRRQKLCRRLGSHRYGKGGDEEKIGEESAN